MTEYEELLIAARYQPTTVGNMVLDPNGGYCNYQAVEILRQRVAELEKELEMSEAVTCVDGVLITGLTAERDALKQQRDELLAAINFSRQGYQAAAENGEPDEVEWAEMYLRSIDAALASVKEK